MQKKIPALAVGRNVVSKFRIMKIAPLLPEHWSMVRTIYGQGIATGNATFQSSPPEWTEWNDSHLPHSRLIATNGEQVAGWAALTPVSGRCVYAGVAEVSVYVGTEYRGQNLGKRLLQALIESSEENGIWTLQAGIFPENIASLRIHEACGFRKVGYRERIGQLQGVWRDTVLLERRSVKVGIN